MKYYIVDVFAERKYTGNQLAVFPEVGDISAADMQKIAQEMHFSETTFITGYSREDGYDVRIFTPQEEIPFAGHPTLGTAYIINEHLNDVPQSNIRLNMKVGTIPVTYNQEAATYWMRQNAPSFGEIYPRDELVKLLEIAEDDIDEGYPVQLVSTGLPFIIVPLRSLDAVKHCHLYHHRESKIPANRRAVLMFSRETYLQENDLNCRVFANAYGVAEDAATGSANGCLAAYLAKYEYFGSPVVDVRVEQGYEMQRPSLLELRTTLESDQIVVHVGGQVIPVAEGVLH